MREKLLYQERFEFPLGTPFDFVDLACRRRDGDQDCAAATESCSMDHWEYAGVRANGRPARVVAEAEERREVMSKRSKRIALILVGVVMTILAVAQHFGWIAGPPPLLAPGIQ